MTKVYLKVYFPFKRIFKHHSFSIEFPRKMRNTVLAVQPDSFPKIRRIGTKIENPLLRVPRNYSSRVEFSKSDRYSGAGHEYRRGIVPGLENRLTLRLTYIPSRGKKDSAV